MLNHQQFKDSKNNKTLPRGSKYLRLDVCDNKEGEDLDKFQGEDERDNM